MTRCAVFALVCALGSAVAPKAALAAGAADITLAWDAPDGCPSATSVVEDVQRILGESPSRAAIARAQVTELAPNRWSVRLVTEIDGAQGERALEAESCAAVANATALVLAWSVDPRNAGVARVESSAPPPRDPPTVASSPSVAAGSSHVRDRTVVRGIAALSGAADVGTLPHLGAAAELTVGALAGPVRIELAGADWISEDGTSGSEGAHLHLLGASLRGCDRFHLTARIELAPCIGGELDVISSSGFGEDQKFTRTAIWGAVRGDAVFTWVLVGPLALRLGAGLAIPVSPPKFVLLKADGSSVLLHQPAVCAGRASLGLEVHFP